MGQLFKKKKLSNSLNSAFLITVLSLALLLSLTQVSKSFGAGQTLVVGMFKEPARLDGRSNSASAHYLPCVVEFLVWPDWDMKLRPQLATSWEISKDGKRYVLYLRKGVKFHCGYPFDAETVKMNLEGALGRLEGWRKSKESGMIESIDKLNVLDKYTVEILLKRPSGIFFRNFNAHYGVTSMLCPACMKKYGKEDFGMKHICGTGPFKFSNWVRGDSVTFVKNENYWGGAPKLDKVIYKIMPDETARVMALEKGEIDLNMGLPAHELEKLKADPNINVHLTESVRTMYWFMNVKKGLTADKRVRKAFAHAVNVPELVKNVVGDIGRPAVACVATRVFGYRDDIRELLPKYDPEKAKKLLAEAGWIDSDGDGILDKEGKPLQITIDSMNHRTPKDKEVTEGIQAYLRKIGVDCKMGIQEWALFVAGYKTLSHDMYTYAWRAVTGDCDYPFSSLLRAGYRWNGSGYDNPRIQELIALGKSEPDPQKRLDIYYEYQKITLDDAVWIPLFHENVAEGTAKYVKGYKPHPNGRPFFHKVYLEQ